MEFKKVTLDDIEGLKKGLADYRGRICDISPANLVFWRDYYDISVYLGDDGIAVRFGDMDGVVSYWCEANRPLIEKIIAHEGGAARFSCLSQEETDFFFQNYSCGELLHERDWDDYLYRAEDIMTLAGKRYCGQRNHINKFNKLYPDAKFVEITAQNAEAVKKFCYGYFHEFGRERAEVAGYEEDLLYEQLDCIERYSQHTLVIFIDEAVAGFSIGETVGDTLIVHTEKADTRFAGIYPALVRAFAERYATEGGYINREEDCGEAGLRISKLSYHPTEIRKKYSLVARLK
ncbi:MAG: DUF2156 domain-containing protein [Clostridia bacterium]|nr:DUF2156 domain-containing protein [Clostridia bacterium]